MSVWVYKSGDVYHQKGEWLEGEIVKEYRDYTLVGVYRRNIDKKEIAYLECFKNGEISAERREASENKQGEDW